MTYIFQCIHEVLTSTDWNVEEAEEILRNNRKKKLKESSRTSKKKRRKLNVDEEVDVDSDEGSYKDKVFNRYMIVDKFAFYNLNVYIIFNEIHHFTATRIRT